MLVWHLWEVGYKKAKGRVRVGIRAGKKLRCAVCSQKIIIPISVPRFRLDSP